MTLLDTATLIAAQAHCTAGQRRKYTNEPYLTHPLEVVSILLSQGIDDEVLLSAAVLHDVLEDCEGWDEARIHTALVLLCPPIPEDVIGCVESANHPFSRIVQLVKELTEPEWVGNRATRKAAEAQRLATISADAQTIKYADLISNTRSIVERDTSFAAVYMAEKAHMLKVMRDGHAGLRASAREAVK